MSELTIEEILWKAIRDIESGVAKTIEEDPVDGLLPLNNKLTKKNISAQSSKYNYLNNYKPISRPTIDSFKNICEYISQKNESVDNSITIEHLKKKNKELMERIKTSEAYSAKVLQENYRLNELVKLLSKDKIN